MGYDGFGAVCIGAIGISQQRTILVGQQETGNDSVYAELGADMKVELLNNGPVTICMDTKNNHNLPRVSTDGGQTRNRS